MPSHEFARYLNIHSAYASSFTPDAQRLAFLTNISGVPQVWQAPARGGVVEYLRFDDEGHGIVKLANRLVCYPAIAAFLDRHLRMSV